jgi:hypothetical protein
MPTTRIAPAQISTHSHQCTALRLGTACPAPHHPQLFSRG